MRSSKTKKTYPNSNKASAGRESIAFGVRFGGQDLTASGRSSIPHLRVKADWVAGGDGSNESRAIVDAISAVIARQAAQGRRGAGRATRRGR